MISRDRFKENRYIGTIENLECIIYDTLLIRRIRQTTRTSVSPSSAVRAACVLAHLVVLGRLGVELDLQQLALHLLLRAVQRRLEGAQVQRSGVYRLQQGRRLGLRLLLLGEGEVGGLGGQNASRSEALAQLPVVHSSAVQ